MILDSHKFGGFTDGNGCLAVAFTAASKNKSVSKIPEVMPNMSTMLHSRQNDKII